MSKQQGATVIKAGTVFLSFNATHRLEHDEEYVVTTPVDTSNPATTGVEFEMTRLDKRKATYRYKDGAIYDYNPIVDEPLNWSYAERNPAGKLVSDYYKTRFPVQVSSS